MNKRQVITENSIMDLRARKRALEVQIEMGLRDDKEVRAQIDHIDRELEKRFTPNVIGGKTEDGHDYKIKNL